MDIPKLDSAILIIFGITGDLALKKLLPALYYLLKEGLLPEQFEIVGVTRRTLTVDELLEDVTLCIKEVDKVCDPKIMQKIKIIINMFTMDLSLGSDYDLLLQFLNGLEDKHGVHMNRLYYLSIPPQVFGSIVTLLGEHNHNSSCQHGAASTRLLIEKPFGFDTNTAKEYLGYLDNTYGDFQVYRIDHYLAKETVQNILTFRFDNPLFEAVWNKRHVSHVVITATETIGIENRVIFYEQTGALRDFIQSHLLQLLALVAMERPVSFDSDEIHKSKLILLNSINQILPDNVATDAIRGQYTTYRDEVKNPKSNIETFAAIKVLINNERWEGIPFIIITGKGMKEKETKIKLVFRETHDGTFENNLIMHIQPNEGISLKLLAKKPGYSTKTQEVIMDFNYADSFALTHPDAYERVLVDALRGDKTLFSTSDEVLSAWVVLENIIQSWSNDDNGLFQYDIGADGSYALDALTAPNEAPKH